MAFTFVCFTCMAQVEADASAPRRKYRVVYVLAITCLRLSPDGSLTDFQRAVLALFVLLACLGLCRCLVGSFILFGSHALLARVASCRGCFQKEQFPGGLPGGLVRCFPNRVSSNSAPLQMETSRQPGATIFHLETPRKWMAAPALAQLP